MNRSLKDLVEHHYDLAIVGGGIYGACIAWDAVLRGLAVCLIDKADFGSATSANSLKIIHSGFRYIQSGNLKAMREFIRERQIWMKIAPHLIHPLPVLVPTYSGWLKTALSAALLINDVISLDRNRLDDPGKYIPKGRMLSKEECLAICPDIPVQELTGGAVFYDAQVYNTERLVLSFLRSAEKGGAVLANYVEATGLLTTGNRVSGIKASDTLTGDSFAIRAATVVNSCGPWSDRVWGSSSMRSTSLPNGYAKAINLVTRSLCPDYAVAAPGANGYQDSNRWLARSPLFFITPWRNHSVIGTHYVPYEGTPDGFEVTEKDISLFLSEINRSWPSANLEGSDILFVHGGLLPSTGTCAQTGSVRLSKNYAIVDHHGQGRTGLFSVIGTKYSAARLVAEKVVDKIFQFKGKRVPKSRTSSTPVYGGEIGPFDSFLRSELEKQPALPEIELCRLLRNYGSAYSEVLQHLELPMASQSSDQTVALLRAEMSHAVQAEMACRLSDAVFRRTELGSAGHPGADALEVCASVMGSALGWSAEQTRSEIESTNRMFSVGGRHFFAT